MSSIRDIHNPWRDELLPARFRDAYFHVEAASLESGRRIVEHEFPKKELPYAEDMGRRAREFSVQAYCICYPFDAQTNAENASLYQRDYRIPRDKLIMELEKIGPGDLQLPTLPKLSVVCARYRVQERRQLGGYAEFDIMFLEAGVKPFPRVISSSQEINNAEASMRGRLSDTWQRNSGVQR